MQPLSLLMCFVQQQADHCSVAILRCYGCCYALCPAAGRPLKCVLFCSLWLLVYILSDSRLFCPATGGPPQLCVLSVQPLSFLLFSSRRTTISLCPFRAAFVSSSVQQQVDYHIIVSFLCSLCLFLCSFQQQVDQQADHRYVDWCSLPVSPISDESHVNPPSLRRSSTYLTTTSRW